MRTSFKIHAGLQFLLSLAGLLAAAFTAVPHGRQRIEITRSTYEALRKDKQTSLFAGYGLIAAGGGGLTLVFAKLDTWSGTR
ncbi:hypothetical protein [Streptomyces fradiae]|uniref:hypothetical protein n=1 Tax=Streptomyces fradiae TaxID=1906 RepID=UPI003515B947